MHRPPTGKGKAKRTREGTQAYFGIMVLLLANSIETSIKPWHMAVHPKSENVTQARSDRQGNTPRPAGWQQATTARPSVFRRILKCNTKTQREVEKLWAKSHVAE